MLLLLVVVPGPLFEYQGPRLHKGFESCQTEWAEGHGGARKEGSFDPNDVKSFSRANAIDAGFFHQIIFPRTGLFCYSWLDQGISHDA